MDITKLIEWVAGNDQRRFRVEGGGSQESVRVWASTFEYTTECTGQTLESFDDISGQLLSLHEQEQREQYEALQKKFGGMS